MLERARHYPEGLSFADFERLLRELGWHMVRTRGNHRVRRSPAGHIVPIQPRGKAAKAYQVRQFVKQHDKEQTRGSKP